MFRNLAVPTGAEGAEPKRRGQSRSAEATAAALIRADPSGRSPISGSAQNRPMHQMIPVARAKASAAADSVPARQKAVGRRFDAGYMKGGPA
jgi:hypothetical protein